MPSPLYIVKNVLAANQLASIAEKFESKAILFIEDGCYNLLKSEMSLFKKCHVIADDAHARGLINTQKQNLVWLSQQDWVELTVKHQPIIQIL